MSWCLYHLAGSPSVQSRLREECAQYGENISLEDLDTLPLLDMVVKEVYRLNPSIPTTVCQEWIVSLCAYAATYEILLRRCSDPNGNAGRHHPPKGSYYSQVRAGRQ